MLGSVLVHVCRFGREMTSTSVIIENVAEGS